MKPTIILDFDRTTFMTEQFVSAVIAVISIQFNVDEITLRAEISDFTTDVLLNYDFYRHMNERYQLVADDATRMVVDGLKGQSFVYDDVPSWLEKHAASDIRIITTGRDDYQSLKLACAPELAGRPFTVTPRLKGDVIREMIEAGTLPPRIWLIDDNPSSFASFIGLLDTRAIQIKRPGTRYEHTNSPEGVEAITNLDQI